MVDKTRNPVDEADEAEDETPLRDDAVKEENVPNVTVMIWLLLVKTPAWRAEAQMAELDL
jgi:hypothetical protein